MNVGSTERLLTAHSTHTRYCQPSRSADLALLQIDIHPRIRITTVSTQPTDEDIIDKLTEQSEKLGNKLTIAIDIGVLSSERSNYIQHVSKVIRKCSNSKLVIATTSGNGNLHPEGAVKMIFGSCEATCPRHPLLCRWLRDTLQQAGIDIGIFGAYSVRGASL